MSLEKQHAEIWNYLREIKVGMLTTSADNFMYSRPMYLVQDHYEGTIWLFSDKNGYKISEIKTNPHVNLNFVSPEDGQFLALSGIASIQVGGPKFEELWSDSVQVWFADSENPKDDAILIKIEVKEAEIWDTNKGMLKKAVEFAKAKLTNSKPNLGENKVMEQ